jgi:hypothetical protein
MVADGFLCGIVEGFYGRPWSHQTRLDYVDYLAQLNLNTYLYCPKADPYLRKRWQEEWPGESRGQLRALAEKCRAMEVLWGVGLSPFSLYTDYGRQQRRQLKAKLDRLAEFGAPLLAILFDDMPGGVKDLAERQAEILCDVRCWATGVRLLVCPTYYSFDPVLERHFGAMPENYLSRLGAALPDGIDVFWTGNAVCSSAISAEDVRAAVELLGRPVTLWDNYPVNDGAVRSNFLYCHPLADRDPGMRPLLRGHLCNPMNQGVLSLPALAGLSVLYGGGKPDRDLMVSALGRATWERLLRDRDRFSTDGLSGLGPEECARLARRYDALPGPAAREVAGWLRGEYTFDPACLTD